MEVAWQAKSPRPSGPIPLLEEIGARITRLASGSDDDVPALVDAIIDGAAVLGATDVHLESDSTGLQVRYRIDGALLPVARVDAPRSANVFTRLKLMSKVVTYRKRGPQDGRVSANASLAVRTAFMPTLHGEKAVLRLPNPQAPTELHELGLLDCDLARLRHVLQGSQGVIFFTGPCSSGKSTSIYAVLRYLLSHSPVQPNIVSLEDPIEQEIAGVNQTQIDPVGGLTFLSGLRTMLRMDPNVIVLGEVRDEETAGTIIQAGLSGHLVITTMHGGSAAQVIARLLHMHIEPFLIASAVSAVVGQRLVRRLCTACREPRTLSTQEEKALFAGVKAPGQIFAPVGCPQCNGTGYLGRTAILEVAVPDEGLRAGILRAAPTVELYALAQAAGMTPLKAAAAAKLAIGETSAEEIARVISE